MLEDIGLRDASRRYRTTQFIGNAVVNHMVTKQGQWKKWVLELLPSLRRDNVMHDLDPVLLVLLRIATVKWYADCGHKAEP